MKLPTVATLAADLTAGRTTSRRLVEQALQRIGDPKGEGSRTFMKVYADTALAEADASDRLRALGVVRSAVEGIPISVKDLFDVAGDTTLAGSKALVGAPAAAADAPAVARLRAAGAIVVGRTAMVEFAFGGVGLNPHYGCPKNPWDRASGGRVPGGSSSGAAVAVADGMCTMALGSDTRGSVRIPSALCGVTGFKPTASRVPKAGAFPLSYTLDSVRAPSRQISRLPAPDDQPPAVLHPGTPRRASPLLTHRSARSPTPSTAAPSTTQSSPASGPPRRSRRPCRRRSRSRGCGCCCPAAASSPTSSPPSPPPSTPPSSDCAPPERRLSPSR